MQYIKCTKNFITEFLLFVLTTTLGGIFLYNAKIFNNYLYNFRIYRFMLLPIIFTFLFFNKENSGTKWVNEKVGVGEKI